VAFALSALFERNGYARQQNSDRVSKEGFEKYKKGDEIRLTAKSKQELSQIRSLLQQAGFKPGKPFIKGRQYRLPIYGRGEVERFQKMVKEHPSLDPSP